MCDHGDRIETHVIQVRPGWIGHFARLCERAGAPFSVMRVHTGSTSAHDVDEADAVPVTRLLLRQQRAAEALDISESALRRLIRNHQLPVVKINGSTRVRVSDLQAYIEALDEPSQGSVSA